MTGSRRPTASQMSRAVPSPPTKAISSAPWASISAAMRLVSSPEVSGPTAPISATGTCGTASR